MNRSRPPPPGARRPKRILVVGAGIAGLTAALRLAHSRHEVVIVERNAKLRTEGYMLDFFGPGYDVAERLNLLDDLGRAHYPIPHLVYVDEHSHITSIVWYAEIRERVFKNRHFNFMRGDLERVLFGALKSAGVEVRFDTSPARIEQDGDAAFVTFEGAASSERFDLVIGADGVRSKVRDLAFGEDAAKFVHLGCHTAAYVTDGRPGDIAPDAFETLTTAHMTAVAYPIRGGRTAAFFVHENAARLEDRSPEACRRELDRTYRGRGWIFDELLDVFPQGDDVYFDDVMQVEVDHWSRGRVALIGDACGAVSLIAGQGASMAMAMAYVLADQLARPDVDIPTALQHYESRVRPPVEARQRSARRNASWFLPKSAFGARVRDHLIRAAVKSPFARLIGRSLGAKSVPLS